MKDNRYVIRIKKNTEQIRPKTIFAFLAVVCLPFHTLTIGGVGILMLVSIPLLLLSLPTLLNRLAQTSWDKATLVLAGFFVYNILGYFWTPSFSFYSLYNYIKIVMIIMCLYCHTYNQREKKFLLLGSCIVSLTVFSFLVLSRNVGYYSGRLTIAVFGVVQDPNYLGFLFIVPMAVAATNLINQNKLVFRILYGVLALICIFCVMTSGSRGALLGLIVVATVCVISRFKGLGAKILFCIAMFGLAVIMYAFILSLLPDHIAARFTIQDIVETRGTRRWDIWTKVVRIIADNPCMVVFGFGTGSSHYLLDGWATHNFFLQLLLELGIVGLGLFLYFVWIWFRRMVKGDIRGLSILMGCMAMSMTLSVNTIYYFWFTFILGIIISSAQPSERRKLT